MEGSSGIQRLLQQTSFPLGGKIVRSEHRLKHITWYCCSSLHCQATENLISRLSSPPRPWKLRARCTGTHITGTTQDVRLKCAAATGRRPLALSALPCNPDLTPDQDDHALQHMQHCMHAPAVCWRHLEGGQAVLVSEDGEQVVAEGVGDMLGPVGVRALSSHQTLDGKALHAPAHVSPCISWLPNNHFRILQSSQGSCNLRPSCDVYWPPLVAHCIVGSSHSGTAHTRAGICRPCYCQKADNLVSDVLQQSHKCIRQVW